jgi:hypothetical protein
VAQSKVSARIVALNDDIKWLAPLLCIQEFLGSNLVEVLYGFPQPFQVNDRIVS